MNLKVEMHRIDGVKRRLSVEVGANEVTQEFNRTYSDLSRSMAVPGFRKGKVPRPVLERLYGNQVQADVFDRLIRASLAEAIQQENIAPLGQPDVATRTAESGQPLRYDATVEVRPEVELGQYAGVEVDRKKHEISDADVDASLTRLQQSYAQLVPVEGRTEMMRGDVVMLDYEARRDGALVSKRDRQEVELGANGFPAGFDDRLLGANVGDTLDFELELGEAQKLDFRVSIHSLSTKELPVLDDEFAKDHGECGSLTELRQRVHTQLSQAAAAHADQEARALLMAKLVATHEFDVPEALVNDRLETMVDDVQREWRARGMPQSDVHAATDKLKHDLAERAREQVKLGLILRAVADREGIAVSAEDVNERIDELASNPQGPSDRLRAVYGSEAGRAYLRGLLLENRAMALVAERAQYNEVPVASSVADPDQSR